MTVDDGDPTGSGGQPPPATGDPSVDAALQRLHESAEAGDLDEQAEVGEATHRALQERLADLGGG
jgi:hypothetical protein